MKFKDLALQTKIISGNCLPLILAATLCAIAFNSVSSLLTSSHWVDHTHDVIENALQIESSAVDMETGMRGYLLAGKEEFLAPYAAGEKRFDELVASLKKTVDDNPDQVALLDEMKKTISEWNENVIIPMITLRRRIGDAETMNDMAKMIQKGEGKIHFDQFRSQIAMFIGREQKLLKERSEAAEKATGRDDADRELVAETLRWVEHTHKVISAANDILTAAVNMETGARGFLLAGEEEFLGPYNEGQKRFQGISISLKAMVDDNPDQVKLIEEISATIDRWQTKVMNPQIALRREIGNSETMDDMAKRVAKAEGKVYFDTFRGQIKTFIDREEKLMDMRQEKAANTAANTKNILIFGTIAMILIALAIAYGLGRAIVKPISRIIHGLNETGDQVAASSSQMASSSQQLSEGASEQAASLEETSSSLEEIASMTRQNSENADQADRLMQEANQTVVEANASMNLLTASMEETSNASKESQKIIKTIDAIAFQTNLLSLNAAVEAARAGEAGAGFAVVAEEVRNLALRSAEAAKNTAALIEDTVERIENGSKLVSKTNDAFAQVALSASKVAGFVSEIAAASREQAGGIEQVNLALSELDKVVQQNTANAEENAGASEEMNAQGLQMKSFVDELVKMVGNNGNGNGNGNGKMRSRQAIGGPDRYPSKRFPSSEHAFGTRALVRRTSNEVRPEQALLQSKDDHWVYAD